MIKRLATVFTTSLVLALLGPTNAHAQASGNSGTTCTQSGQQVTCTTTTVFNMPSGVNLQSGSGLNQITFTGTAIVGPACTGLSAAPNVVTANQQTTVILSVSGCPNGVNYAWASPVAQVNNPVTSHALTLASGSQLYSVVVCFDANASACSTYQTTVSVQSQSTPNLSGCLVTPSASSLVQGTTGTVTASCTQGTGQAGYGVTYQWTRNGTDIAGATGSSYTITSTDTAATGNLIMGVRIGNNAPSTAAPSTTIVVTSPTSGGGGQNFCPGGQAANTFINASETYRKIYSTNLIGSNTHWVVRIPVTAGDTTLNRLVAQLNFGEAPSNQRSFRKVSLSKNLCDYTNNPGTTYLITSNSNSGSLEFRINESTRQNYPVELTTGTWYFNVQNTSCASGQRCDALLEWLN
jgi:hypothetical protein